MLNRMGFPGLHHVPYDFWKTWCGPRNRLWNCDDLDLCKRKKMLCFFKKSFLRPQWPFFQTKFLPDEEDLVPFTAADSATPDDLKREERRVSRLAADPEAPADTPPEAAPKPVEELFPELRLLVLLPQDSWYRVLYIMRPLYLKYKRKGVSSL